MICSSAEDINIVMCSFIEDTVKCDVHELKTSYKDMFTYQTHRHYFYIYICNTSSSIFNVLLPIHEINVV